MQKNVHFSQRRLTAGIGVSLLLAFVMVMAIIQAIFASPLAADLNSSSKAVSQEQAFPGQPLQYAVVINNSGDTTAQNVSVTDTLPVSLTYVVDSLTYAVDNAATTGIAESNGVITWTGVISAQGSATLYYQAVLTDTLAAGDEITNTVYITGTGELLQRSASTTVINSMDLFFPVVFRPVPIPELNPIVRTSATNSWTVSWIEPDPGIEGYEIQEDSDTSFASPETFSVGTDLSREFSPSAVSNHLYCYRVRATISGLWSSWSNIQCVYGNYYDDFSDNTTGWSIRRQDTDDVDNDSYYTAGTFVTKIRGRWDYAISSPLEPIIWDSYEIVTRAKLSDGVDNLHAYGIIFGGDWNGGVCPNINYSSCFNHYYRLNVIYFGDNSNALRIKLKRIDYHQPDDNAGSGETLFGYRDVSTPDPSGWNDWRITVESNGKITVYLNDREVGSAVDGTYIYEPYFGVFASSDEYSGTAATFDYYGVNYLP